VGYTRSSNGFPVANAYQGAIAGGNDAYITKLDSAGQVTAFTFSTFLGGTGDDRATGIAVEPGRIVVTGRTDSTNFPTKNPYQGAYQGGSSDAFSSKFDDQSGKPPSMTFSTYLGGSSSDFGEGIATKGTRFYIVGSTASSDFPTKAAFQDNHGGSNDVFVVNFKMPVKAKVFSFGRAANIEE
jgi:hypothetical protein